MLLLAQCSAGGGEEGERVGIGGEIGPLIGHEVGDDFAEVPGILAVAEEEAGVEAGRGGVELGEDGGGAGAVYAGEAEAEEGGFDGVDDEELAVEEAEAGEVE